MKYNLTGSLLLIALMVTGCVTRQPLANGNGPAATDPNEPKPDAPLTAETHFAAGQVAEGQKDFPRAIVQFEAASKLDGTAPLPLLHLGLIYTQTGQYDRAVTAWKQYIKATNQDAAGYCNLGYTLELAQRVPEAETAYQTAIARQPRNETARVNYGLMLARAGRLAEATNQLQVVLTPAEAHYNLAAVFESEGKKSAARAEYQRALELDPDMNDAKLRLAAMD